jgi:hypothetical protein
VFNFNIPLLEFFARVEDGLHGRHVDVKHLYPQVLPEDISMIIVCPLCLSMRELGVEKLVKLHSSSLGTLDAPAREDQGETVARQRRSIRFMCCRRLVVERQGCIRRALLGELEEKPLACSEADSAGLEFRLEGVEQVFQFSPICAGDEHYESLRGHQSDSSKAACAFGTPIVRRSSRAIQSW